MRFPPSANYNSLWSLKLLMTEYSSPFWNGWVTLGQTEIIGKPDKTFQHQCIQAELKKL